MEKTVNIRMTGADGNPMPEYLLQTLYSSDLRFEPDIRRSRVLSDGSVELLVGKSPYMLHARVDLPLYGNIWVMAHNRGEGYTGNRLDFVPEAVDTYLGEAEGYSAGLRLSPYARGHLEAAKEYRSLSEKGVDPDYCRLKALTHAVLAAEAACFEAAQAKIARAPRSELLLGCNLFKYPGPSRFADYFSDVFNFATLPFYSRELVPEEGRYEYGRRDELLEWCEANGIIPKGHPLWFGHQKTNPGWMFGKSYGELSRFARESIARTVRRYRGRIRAWDSINEPHDWANCFGFTQAQLLELTHTCCETVRASDPEAVSIINVCLPFGEYVAGRFVCYGPVFDKPVSPLAFFERALDRGVDFDAVGVQLYFPARDLTAISRLLVEYARFGKPVHITEMGVPGGTARMGTENAAEADPRSQIGLTRGGWHSPWNEHVQADWLEQFYTIAASRPFVSALTWWDFMDPGFMPTSPFLFEDQVPREMYFRLKALRLRLLGSTPAGGLPEKQV